MKSRQRILACGLFAIFAGACGGGGDDGSGDGPDVETGLPAGDALSELSNADTVQICEKTASALNNLLPRADLERIACAGGAVSEIVEDKGDQVSSKDIPMCKELSDECLKSDEIKNANVTLDIADETECKGATTKAVFGDCDATVADYESCVGKIASELRTRFKSLTCDVLAHIDTLDETLNGKIDVSNAAECKALRTKCPDVDLSLEAAE
ncbi:MAG TPA: hypothetical protein VJV78_18475 [Polyangiales bacterium]|nr:hypothetical protein [Polyangiales bacterium]